MKDFSTFLLERKVVEPALLEQQLEPGLAGSEPVYYRLLRRHPELEESLWKALAEFLQVELLDPQDVQIDPRIARLLPARLAYEHSIVPIRQTDQVVEIVMADPRQFEKCDELAMLLEGREQKSVGVGKPLSVTPRLARPSTIAGLIKSVYGIGADTVEDMLSHGDGHEPAEAVVSIVGGEVVDLTESAELGEDAAIIRFVNQILLEAVSMGASDIHLEPFEKELRLRYRVDGMLRAEPVPERIKHLEAAIISRLKIMSRLDIAEKRLPQDGQIRLAVMGRPVDVRVSVLPTMFGQGLALRLLDRQLAFRQLDNLGIPDDYLRLYRKVLGLSHGVILVTGPTGSGKTTTLYASLHEVSRNDRKVITVEDPIEYQLEGITQIQVRPEIDMSFANLLRNILRHDPDIIMVGEIRDTDTAQIAISAAMTGHLVFSTLHTNDASSAPVRLLEMRVEPFLVSSALEAVGAQRLIRVLCQKCRKAVTAEEAASPEELALAEEGPVYQSTGCADCRQSGFKGRTAIFEMFSVNDSIRQLIIGRGNATQIRDEVVKLGMRTLHQSGMEKVRQGITSLAEVYRVARDETIDMREQMGNKNDVV